MTPSAIFISGTALLFVIAAVGLRAAPDEALQTRAGQGDTAAQLEMAVLYSRGSNGEPRDPARALMWANRAAEQGHKPAYEILGMILITESDEQVRDLPQAARWFQKAIDEAPPALLAKSGLGLLLIQGRGVPEDATRGRQLIDEAAAAGSEEAREFQAELAKRGNLNRIMPRDKPDAKLLGQAEQGDPEAQFQLAMDYMDGRIDVPDRTKISLVWLQRSAEAGWAAAQFELGGRHLTGLGAKKDIPRALQLMQWAADQGMVPAQLRLGLLYYAGSEGLARDDRLAATYLKRAVIENQKSAEIPYAYLLFEGRGGLTANTVEAGAILTKAEVRGDKKIRTYLYDATKAGKYQPVDSGQLRRLLDYGAYDRKDLWALERLGHFQVTGQGLPQNVEQGLTVLKAAAVQGSFAAAQAAATVFGQRLDQMLKDKNNYSPNELSRTRNDWASMVVAFAANGKSEHRLAAAKALTKFSPPEKLLLKNPPESHVLDAMALVRIFRDEGGNDAAAFQWLATMENHLRSSQGDGGAHVLKLVSNRQDDLSRRIAAQKKQ